MVRLSSVFSVFAIAATGALAAGAEEMVEWRYYGADPFSSKYSPADQIDASNVSSLKIAWRWESADKDIEAARMAGPFKATPIMVDGVVYVSTALSQVCAVDGATGATIWTYDPKSWERGRPTNTGFQHRGVSYWEDGEDKRVFIATGNRQLVALNAKTGQPCEGFGANGMVELAEGLGRTFNEKQLGYNAPVAVVKDTIIIGSIIFDGPTTKEMPPGHVRGFDVRTGAQKWTFHTIPQDGEFGNETWEEESWRYTGNTNVWSMMSVDPELGYVYLPVSTPTNDYYGGHRKGDNLFAESLVCLNAETGERIWHFQGVHHGLWDYDFPCAPNLLDITVDGKRIKAVAQVSKQAMTYVFDRATGEPVWPIEERPVPQTDVPGEQTSPTQPFPTKPAPFDKHGIGEEDLIDFTPELHAKAKAILDMYRPGPIFTPPALADQKATIMLPGSGGGANWGGAAVDPETGVLYVPSMTFVMLAGLVQPDQNRSNFKYLRGGLWAAPTIDGLQIVKPPYGRITAIDLNTGDHLWMVAHGQGPKHHPGLAGLDLQDLGTLSIGQFVNSGGPMLTKTLLFTSQVTRGQPHEKHPEGVSGYLRAFDKKTGANVANVPLENGPHGVPMTYVIGGKQYIIIACGGGGQPAELVALALPGA